MMKFSSKIEKCGLSPMRKFAPYAAEAVKKGKKVYHLNIGQPDIATPEAYFEAVRSFSQPVLAYAPSDGVPEMISAIVDYYGKIDAPITDKQVLITTGGSEALQIVLSCILDEGDEIIIPEPFYPNYSTVECALRLGIYNAGDLPEPIDERVLAGAVFLAHGVKVVGAYGVQRCRRDLVDCRCAQTALAPLHGVVVKLLISRYHAADACAAGGKALGY